MSNIMTAVSIETRNVAERGDEHSYLKNVVGDKQ